MNNGDNFDDNVHDTNQELSDYAEPIESIETREEKKDRLFNSRQLSDVVKRERDKAYQKGRRDAESYAINNSNLSPEQIKQLIADEAPRYIEERANNMRHQDIANNFLSKIKASEEKYPELMDEIGHLDHEKIAPIIVMANELDNTADVMKELIDKPTKIAQIMELLHLSNKNGAPHLAIKEMHNLSQSIKKNNEAVENNRSSRPPIGQLKASIAPSGVDEKNMSVSDLRDMLRNRN